MKCSIRKGHIASVTMQFIYTGCTKLQTLCANRSGAWLSASTICNLHRLALRPLDKITYFRSLGKIKLGGLARITSSTSIKGQGGAASGGSAILGFIILDTHGGISLTGFVHISHYTTVLIASQGVAGGGKAPYLTIFVPPITAAGVAGGGQAKIIHRMTLVASGGLAGGGLAALVHYVRPPITAAGLAGGGTATVSPSAPTGLIATPGTASVALTWSAPATGATSYNILRGTMPGAETVIQSGNVTTSYTDNTSVNGITYFYTVQAVNATGTSHVSNEVSGLPTGSYYALDHFTGTNSTNLTAHTMDVGNGWTALSGSYQIQTNKASTVGNASLYFTDTGISNGTISIIVNRNGTDPGNPAMVAFRGTDSNNFWTLNVAASQFALGWKQNGSFGGPPNAPSPQNITPGSSDHTVVITLNDNSISATYDGGAAISVISDFNKSATKVGLLAYPTVLFDDLTLATVSPATPTTVAVTPYDSSALISWDAQTGVTFNIYQGTTPGGESAIPVAANIMDTSYQVVGLTNNTTYYWKVTAVGGSESARSLEVTTTPVAYTSSLLTNLVFYAELNEAAGATRVDVINANNLTDHNTVGQTSGINGGEFAANFNGTSHYLSHADVAALHMGSNVSITVAAWAKTGGDTGTHQTLISKDDTTSAREYSLVLLRSFPNFTPRMSIYNNNTDAGANVQLTTTTDFSNKFHLVGGYYDAVAQKIGIRQDGKVSDTSGQFPLATYITGGAASSANFLVGTLGEGGPTQWFKGGMCKAMVWKRTLDSQEWIDLFARGQGNNSNFNKYRMWRKWNSNSDPRVLKTPANADAVFEPRVWRNNSTSWKMAHSNLINLNNGLCTISISSSTDGINWGPSIIAVGGGVGGEPSYFLARSGVYVEGSTIYLTYSNLSNSHGQINLASSTDGGLTFNRIATDLVPIANLPVGSTVTANSFITKDNSTYVLSLDYYNGTLWSAAIATASSVTGPYTVIVNDVTTLKKQNGFNVATSHPHLFKDGNGLWHAFYHKSRDTGSQANSILYHATNADYTTDNWTDVNGGAPYLNYTEAPANYGAFPVDQNADPWIIDCGSTVRCYYDLDVNTGPVYKADICMAYYPGTMAQLLADENV